MTETILRTGRVLFVDKVTQQGQWRPVQDNEGSIEVHIGRDLARTPDGWVTLSSDLISEVVWDSQQGAS